MGILSMDTLQPIIKSLIHLINNKPNYTDIPKVASDKDILDAMIESDVLCAIGVSGDIVTDENGNILLW